MKPRTNLILQLQRIPCSEFMIATVSSNQRLNDEELGYWIIRKKEIILELDKKQPRKTKLVFLLRGPTEKQKKK